jgi:hypothetical protein
MSLSFEVDMGREGTGGDFKISLKPRRCCFVLACRDKVPSGAYGDLHSPVAALGAG